MNKIEVRSNTEFSQPYHAFLQKRGFVGHQMGVKKTHYAERKETYCIYVT